MSVYIDDGSHRYGRMRMCHMLADSHAELMQIAEEIGLRSSWIQYPGTYREHFDICQAKRKLAIQAGATSVSRRSIGAMLSLRRKMSEE